MLLRVAALSVALVLLFDSGIVSPVTKQLSLGTQTYLASVVGATASVEPNGLNTVTAELTKRQQELDVREASLNEREINVAVGGSAGENADLSTYLMSVVLFILLVLITLNYALDFARQKRLTYLEHEPQT